MSSYSSTGQHRYRLSRRSQDGFAARLRGKTSLGRITKRGDDYLRTLLIQGAKSAVMTADRRRDRISLWLVQLTARVGWQKAVVAMANKNARILWALLTKGRRFDADHVPIKPEGCALAATAA